MKCKYTPAEFEDFIKSNRFNEILWNTANQDKTPAYDSEHINMKLSFDSAEVFHFPTCFILSDSKSSNTIIINNFEYAVYVSSSALGELFEIVYKNARENTYHSVNLMLKGGLRQ